MLTILSLVIFFPAIVWCVVIAIVLIGMLAEGELTWGELLSTKELPALFGYVIIPFVAMMVTGVYLFGW